MGTVIAIGVKGERERGGRQTGTNCWLTGSMSANRSLNTIPQNGSGDIASRAKRNSYGSPYGLILQLDIVTQKLPLLGKVPGKGRASFPVVPQSSVIFRSFHWAGIWSWSLDVECVRVCTCMCSVAEGSTQNALHCFTDVLKTTCLLEANSV